MKAMVPDGEGSVRLGEHGRTGSGRSRGARRRSGLFGQPRRDIPAERRARDGARARTSPARSSPRPRTEAGRPPALESSAIRGVWMGRAGRRGDVVARGTAGRGQHRGCRRAATRRPHRVALVARGGLADRTATADHRSQRRRRALRHRTGRGGRRRGHRRERNAPNAAPGCASSEREPSPMLPTPKGGSTSRWSRSAGPRSPPPGQGAPTGLFIWFGQASRQPVTLDFFDWVDGTVGAPIRQFDYTRSDRADGEDLAALVGLVEQGGCIPRSVGSAVGRDRATSSTTSAAGDCGATPS